MNEVELLKHLIMQLEDRLKILEALKNETTYLDKEILSTRNLIRRYKWKLKEIENG